MEKEFIPYEQALALKELGFDEHCLKIWEKTMLFTTLVNPEEFKRVVSERYTKAPTFSQAFRFFREKYGIYGYPFSQSSQTNYWFKYFIQQDWKEQITSDSFSTSEEAELECLIKLIEIVKEKK
jgi:hypothetical protein